MNSEDEMNRYRPRCGDCNHCFASKKKLTRHMNFHTRGTLFSCKLCGDDFTRRSSVTKHVKRVHLKNVYSDSTVSKLLEENILVTTKEVPFHYCDICYTSYSTLELQRDHNCKSKSDVELLSVKREKVRLADESLHVQKLGGSSCNATNISELSLKHENVSDDNMKLFSCVECGKSFSRKQSLNAHSRVHISERQFVCKLCESAFKRRYDLSRHLRDVHLRQGRNRCTLCRKVFGTIWNLKKHVRNVHEKISAVFKCDVCSAEFPNSDLLKNHLIDDHINKKTQFQCFCQEYFCSEDNLNNHMLICSWTGSDNSSEDKNETQEPSKFVSDVSVEVSNQQESVEIEVSGSGNMKASCVSEANFEALLSSGKSKLYQSGNCRIIVLTSEQYAEKMKNNKITVAEILQESSDGLNLSDSDNNKTFTVSAGKNHKLTIEYEREVNNPGSNNKRKVI